MATSSRVQDNIESRSNESDCEIEIKSNSLTLSNSSGTKRERPSQSKPSIPRKAMLPRSEVWQHLTVLPSDAKKCTCNYCGVEFCIGHVAL